jgi:transcriptional regulator with XRE-family HTH domain
MTALTPSGKIPRMMKAATVGARVKAAREARGFSQTSFAAAMGVTRGAVSNWDTGAGITRKNLIRAAEITGASIDWLMTGQGASGVEVADAGGLFHLADLPPLDVDFLEALLSATLAALGLSAEKSAFLARAVIGAARRPQSEQEAGFGEDLTTRVAAALARAILSQ